MQINTQFDINDFIYCIHDDSIIHGKVVQITVVVDSYGAESKKFVVFNNFDGHDQYCDKYHHEMYLTIDDLVSSIKKEAKKIIKRGQKNVN